jgi:hypothetical protein
MFLVFETINLSWLSIYSRFEKTFIKLISAVFNTSSTQLLICLLRKVACASADACS